MPAELAVGVLDEPCTTSYLRRPGTPPLKIPTAVTSRLLNGQQTGPPAADGSSLATQFETLRSSPSSKQVRAASPRRR
ncbi:MAG: hypothetical protein L0H84_14875 [Pseudonocardia sp.]|nr:hypothetical protein [Pseudonocardia sp.]